MAALTFHAFFEPKIEKMVTQKNGDPKTGKGPHGDPGPQMGTHLGAVPLVKGEGLLRKILSIEAQGQGYPFNGKF